MPDGPQATNTEEKRGALASVPGYKTERLLAWAYCTAVTLQPCVSQRFPRKTGGGRGELPRDRVKVRDVQGHHSQRDNKEVLQENGEATLVAPNLNNSASSWRAGSSASVWR